MRDVSGSDAGGCVSVGWCVCSSVRSGSVLFGSIHRDQKHKLNTTDVIRCPAQRRVSVCSVARARGASKEFDGAANGGCYITNQKHKTINQQYVQMNRLCSVLSSLLQRHRRFKQYHSNTVM